MDNTLLYNIDLKVIADSAQSVLEGVKGIIDNIKRSSQETSEESKKELEATQKGVEDLTKVVEHLNEEVASPKGGKPFEEIEHGAEKAANTVQSEADKMQEALRGIKTMAFVQNFQSVANAAQTITAPAMEFQQSMADLSAITGIVGKDLDNLGAKARQFGKESGLGAAGAAESYKILASQIQVDSIGMEGLNNLQEKTITLAQAAGMSMADAANSLAGTINQFGMGAEEAERVINVLAAGSKYGAAEITELSQSFKVTGAVAAGFGISVEQTAGALEVLSKNNLKGAEAGTALRNVMLSMKTTLGMDIGEMGLANGLKQLQPMLSDTTLLAKTFGKENVAAAQFLISHADAVNEMTGKLTETNTAYEQAEIATDTWAHKQEVAKAKMEDLLISITNVTGGIAPFVATAGQMLVPFAQLAPMIDHVKAPLARLSSGIVGLVKDMQTLGAAQTVLSAKTALLTKAKAAWTVVQRALNVALKSNPIGAVVTAVAALVAIVVYAYKHNENFKKSVDRLWEGLKNVWAMINEKLAPIFEKLKAVFMAILPIIKKVGEFLVNFILNIVMAVIDGITWLLEKLGFLSEEEANLADKAKDAGVELDKTKVAIDGQAQSATAAAQATDRYSEALKNMGLNAMSAAFSGNDIDDGLNALMSKLKNAQSMTMANIAEGIQQLNAMVANSTFGSDEQKRAMSILNAYKRLEAQRKKALGLDGGSDAHSRTTQKRITDLNTMAGLQNRISALQEKQKGQTIEQAVVTQREIAKLQEKLQLMRDALEMSAPKPIKVDVAPLKGGLLKHLMDADAKEKDEAQKRIQPIVDQLGKSLKPMPIAPLLTPIELYKKKLEETRRTMSPITNTVNAMSNAMYNLSGIVGKGAASWLAWGANVLQAVGQALPQLATLFGATAPVAAAEGAKAVAGIPVVGPAMAVAAAASILGSLLAMPKPFAEGGIVYGTTYAMVGEYAGAANNPEVIAPLNKLKDIITPTGGSQMSNVEFKIQGRTLVGLLKAEQRHNKLV